MKHIKSINEYNDEVYSKNLKPYILTDNRLKLIDEQSKLSKYMKSKIVYVNSSIVDKINNISDLSDKSINLFKSLITNKDIANSDIFNDKLKEKGFKLYKVILKNDNIIVEEYNKKLQDLESVTNKQNYLKEDLTKVEEKNKILKLNEDYFIEPYVKMIEEYKKS
jgi:hypothetical protein